MTEVILEVVNTRQEKTMFPATGGIHVFGETADISDTDFHKQTEKEEDMDITLAAEARMIEEDISLQEFMGDDGADLDAAAEGLGMKEQELSPQQLSREKRKIVVRKLSYGRRGEIRELVRKLIEGKEKDIDEVARKVTFGKEKVNRRLSFGTKENVRKLARRLSMEKGTEDLQLQLHLARMSMYFSESRMC